MAALGDDRPTAPPAAEALLLLLLLRGALPPADLAAADGRTPEALERDLAELTADGSVRLDERASRALELTEAGRARAAAALAHEAATLGPLLAPRYAEFATLNRRLKATLHCWQVRSDGGVERLNDHRDARYDAQVLADLRATHLVADAWLAPLAAWRARYAALRERLSHALARAAAGDRTAVAGVTGDSFHLAWWQLHADLLRVLGRERGADDA